MLADLEDSSSSHLQMPWPMTTSEQDLMRSSPLCIRQESKICRCGNVFLRFVSKRLLQGSPACVVTFLLFLVHDLFSERLFFLLVIAAVAASTPATGTCCLGSCCCVWSLLLPLLLAMAPHRSPVTNAFEGRN